MVAVVLLTGTGCGTGGMGTPGDGSVKAVNAADSSSGPVPSSDLASVADAVDRLGQEQFAEYYAGVAVQNGRLVVHRLPGSGLDEAVRALPGVGPVTFQAARYSLARLQPLRRRLESDVAYWAGQGITIAAVAIPADGSGVEVTTPQADRARTELLARYGSDPILLVVAGGPISVAPAATS